MATNAERDEEGTSVSERMETVRPDELGEETLSFGERLIIAQQIESMRKDIRNGDRLVHDRIGRLDERISALILKNADAIAKNADAIAANSVAIAKNAEGIEGLKALVAINAEGIAENRKVIREGLAEERRLMEAGFAESRRLMQEGLAEERRFMEAGFAESRRLMQEGLAEERRLMQEGLAEERRLIEANAKAIAALTQRVEDLRVGIKADVIAANKEERDRSYTRKGWFMLFLAGAISSGLTVGLTIAAARFGLMSF